MLSDNSLPNMMIQSKTNNHLSLIIWLGVLYNCKETFTDVMSALQISPFLTNKPNFRKSQMNVNKVLTKDYEKKTLGGVGKTNPIQSQFKANQTQLKPIKRQNKPKTNPILVRHQCGGSEPIYAAAFDD